MHTQRHAEKWLANHDFLNRATAMIPAHPDLLKLHQIDPDQLATEGISCEEFIYLYLNFDAASALYRISGDPSVQLTEYRKNILQNAKVRMIWKRYLRPKLFNPTPFALAVDAYIDDLEVKDRDTLARSPLVSNENPNRAAKAMHSGA
jgi:hypothetical protein